MEFGGMKMPEQKKRNQYEFDKKKYDHVHLQLTKGKKSELQAHATSQGESLNAFVNRAIDEAVERDKGVEVQTLEPLKESPQEERTPVQD
jgi:tRNA U54 and U55 pseudouridine synthase Pus10